MKFTGEFAVDRDAAIIATAHEQNWQIFYEFCVEYGLTIPIACPREKMGMVMAAAVILHERKGNTETGIGLTVELSRRGLVFAPKKQGLINRNENNRPVAFPDCLKLFATGETPDGSATDGNGESGSGVDSAGSDPDNPVPSSQGGLQPTGNKGTPISVRRRQR